ncbi:MAG: AraC family transcriptional regulator [Pseudomonadota bacterium]
MKNLELSIPARYLAQLVDHLRAAGLDCDSLLAAAQIRNLDDPNALVSNCQVDQLLRGAAALSGRSDLGFELGRQIKLNSHGPLGYAIISSQTIDQALRLVTRYQRLLSTMFSMRYQRHAQHAEICFQPSMAMAEPTRLFYLEAIATAFHAQLQALGQGTPVPCDAWFAMAPPPHAQRYRELAGMRAHFDAAPTLGLRIAIGLEQFDRQLPMADLRAQAEAEARCTRLLRDLHGQRNWGDWVAMMLRQAEDTQPTLEQLARVLNMSVSTLERYLEREQVSFRNLALAIRNERARQMLDSGNSTVSQIAYRLGYTDLANFSRSFKRSNGISPTAYLGQLARA